MSTEIFSGMTLRDYFAAKAMQTLAADSADWPSIEQCELISTYSYALADAMLAEREK